MAKYWERLSKEEQEEILKQMAKQREQDKIDELMGENPLISTETLNKPIQEEI